MGGRRKQKRELRGTLYIVGEGITEQHYFAHLKQLQKFNCVVKPRFCGNTSIPELERTVKKLLLGGVNVICVFDADVASRDEVEKKRLHEFKRKYSKNSNVLLCDSMPAIEFWFLLHFVKTTRLFNNTNQVVSELQKYIPDYCKETSYLKNPAWVAELCSDSKLDLACERAGEILQEKSRDDVGDLFPYTKVFEAIKLMNDAKT